MLSLFMQGVEAVFTLQILGLLFFGTVVGIVFGAIPGLTATMAVALFLPVTYGMDPGNGRRADSVMNHTPTAPTTDMPIM